MPWPPAMHGTGLKQNLPALGRLAGRMHAASRGLKQTGLRSAGSGLPFQACMVCMQYTAGILLRIDICLHIPSAGTYNPYVGLSTAAACLTCATDVTSSAGDAYCTDPYINCPAGAPVVVLPPAASSHLLTWLCICVTVQRLKPLPAPEPAARAVACL